MAKISVSKLVEDALKPIIENLGYELVEVKYAKDYSGMALTLYVYSQSGITLDDCEKISKAVDQPLDQLNPTGDQPYTLNVSSLGLDRPIKNKDDARRCVGCEIEIKLYAPKDGQKIFKGVLSDYDDQSISIDIQEHKMTFKFTDIALASRVIDF